MAILLVGLLWAIESVLGKVAIIRGYGAFDFPIVLNAGTVAMCLCACLWRVRGNNVLSLKRRSLVAQVSVALSLVFVPYLIIYLSLKVLTPAETSLLSSLTPMFSLLLSAILFRSRVKISTVGYVLIGLVGVAFLIIPQLKDPTHVEQVIWYVVMLAVPASYALSGFAIRRVGEFGVGYVQLLLVTNTVSLTLFLIVNRGFVLSSSTRIDDVVVFLIGIGCNILSVIIILRLSRTMLPLMLSMANYATVLCSFLLTAIYLNESVGTGAVAAALLIVFSSLMLSRSREGVVQ